MLCGCNNYNLLLPRKDPRMVSGTLDFKWPRGSEIKVGIQQPHPDLGPVIQQLGRARRVLSDAMSAWNEVLAERLILVSADATGFLPPPTHRNRAGSPPETRGASYDVLVSFAPLPIYKEANVERPERSIRFPSSSLGTYCRRARYGVPTLYAGEPAGFVGSEEWAEQRTWFESNEFKFTVLHELGHVLGLAHEHQNPYRELADEWKSAAEVIRIVEARERVRVDEEYVNENLIKPWPLDPHGAFSEWQKDVGTPTVIESIMSKPLYACLLKSNGCDERHCVDPTRHRNFANYLKLTDWDRQQIDLMYGPARGVPATLAPPSKGPPAARRAASKAKPTTPAPGHIAPASGARPGGNGVAAGAAPAHKRRVRSKKRAARARR